MNLALRKATLEDSAMILGWRNEATTIPWMAKTTAITVEEHNDWYSKTVTSPDTLFFIIEIDNEPIGQLRYTLQQHVPEKVAVVSINITHKMHGKGIATEAFIQGNIAVDHHKFCDTIIGNARANNKRSIKALMRANYKCTGRSFVHEAEHMLMTHIVGEQQ
jgi:RimJ/RimL family protein N-acetyltransferase